MGPNGSGKSTLANVLMGNPSYKVTGGDVIFKGESLLSLTPDERARMGLFLAFQYPVAVPGVTLVNFLRQAVNAKRGADVPIREFRESLFGKMDLLKMDQDFARRYVNDGFSGGEKKRAEMLQMAMLEPSMAVLDETDSGLDIDALAHGRRRRQRADEPGDGPAADHALPAAAELHQAAVRPRARRRPDRAAPAGRNWPSNSKPTGYDEFEAVAAATA